MQDFLSGLPVDLSFTYGKSHEPDLPDVGSVFYTVMDHSGTPIPDLTDIAIPISTGTFQSRILVDGTYNVVLADRLFARRTIFIRYTVNGSPRGQTIPYRLIPVPQYTVTPKSVRTFLGVNQNELPDEDIDLFSTYLYVKEELGADTIDDALVSGGIAEVSANEAITMRAAIDIIPSLQNRVAQSEKNGVKGFDRIKIKDFSELMAVAMDRYLNAVGVVSGIDVAGVDYTLITVTQDADPVTGG